VRYALTDSIGRYERRCSSCTNTHKHTHANNSTHRKKGALKTERSRASCHRQVLYVEEDKGSEGCITLNLCLHFCFSIDLVSFA
jgi:hypothetical protein